MANSFLEGYGDTIEVGDLVDYSYLAIASGYVFEVSPSGKGIVRSIMHSRQVTADKREIKGYKVEIEPLRPDGGPVLPLRTDTMFGDKINFTHPEPFFVPMKAARRF